MSNRRELILNTARRLFWERGYDGVSMRDIAKELDFSVGNVTYYFKKKEDLMEASVLEQSKSYHLPATPASLAELNHLFWYICQGILERLYYFHHYDQMGQISRRVHELQQAFTKDLYLTLTGAFENLQESGDMEQDFYPGQNEYFVQGVMTAMTYGLPQSLRLDEDGRDEAMEFMMCIWSLVYPRLTEKGRNTFHTKIYKKKAQKDSSSAVKADGGGYAAQL
ncbi:MAG: TetR family transcriptional regulator [Lachnospiraceae bacterium]|nr:TetR family transcriptional regulator [Lachnospiraceae bacterium]